MQAAAALALRSARDVPAVGPVAAATLFFASCSTRRPLSTLAGRLAPALLTIRPRGYRAPLTFRRTGTDGAVIHQVLVHEEYRPVASLETIDVIVDCGANIGATSYYLLHRYPRARVVAIEPDAENFELCRRNLAAFGSRAVVIHAAVWPERLPLRIVPASRALGSWGLQVEPADGDSVEFYGLPMRDILDLADVRLPIDLLKLDIEGAEEHVFRGDCDEWLGCTRHMAIELHGAASEQALVHALGAYTYRRRQAGELTLIDGLDRLDGARATFASPRR
jgi:FkbM family methyltransferase